jgi:hypothetical protein
VSLPALNPTVRDAMLALNPQYQRFNWLPSDPNALARTYALWTAGLADVPNELIKPAFLAYLRLPGEVSRWPPSVGDILDIAAKLEVERWPALPEPPGSANLAADIKASSTVVQGRLCWLDARVRDQMRKRIAAEGLKNEDINRWVIAYEAATAQRVRRVRSGKTDMATAGLAPRFLLERARGAAGYEENPKENR